MSNVDIGFTTEVTISRRDTADNISIQVLVQTNESHTNITPRVKLNICIIGPNDSIDSFSQVLQKEPEA